MEVFVIKNDKKEADIFIKIVEDELKEYMLQ